MFLKIKKQLKLRIIIFLLSSKVEWNQIYKILAKIETSRLSNTNNLDLKCFLSISAIKITCIKAGQQRGGKLLTTLIPSSPWHCYEEKAITKKKRIKFGVISWA